MQPWTEIFSSDWRSMKPLMNRLGIKGGYDTYTSRDAANPALSAASLADDATLLIERGPVVEEWSPSGRTGVHLVWDHEKDSLEQLEEMLSVDAPLYSGFGGTIRKQLYEMWEPGQRRMVAVFCPAANVETFWRAFAVLTEDVKGVCDLHYLTHLKPHHVPFQFGKMFGGMFTSATVPPVSNYIILPNGSRVPVAEAHERSGIERWTSLVGFDLDQATMEGPLGTKTRKALSLASAFWASRNWSTLTPSMEEAPDQPEWAEEVARVGATPELLVTVKSARLALVKEEGASPRPELGDMIGCNACSLFDRCRLARVDSVCALPESDMGELAEFFKTRDAGKVIDGLGELLARQADRVDKAMAAEEQLADSLAAGTVSPRVAMDIHEDVTRMLHGLFDRGVKLAKLNDPRLNSGGPQVAVNLTNNNAGMITGGSPQQLAAGVVAELEAQGVRREDITPELIMQHLGGAQPVAIEANIVKPDDPVLGYLPER